MWTVMWPDHLLTLNHISPCEQWCKPDHHLTLNHISPCEQWCDQTTTLHWTTFHHVNSGVTRPTCSHTEPHFTMWTVMWPDHHLTLNHISPCEQWCDQTTSHWTTFHYVNSGVTRPPPSHTEPHFTLIWQLGKRTPFSPAPVTMNGQGHQKLVSNCSLMVATIKLEKYQSIVIYSPRPPPNLPQM